MMFIRGGGTLFVMAVLMAFVLVGCDDGEGVDPGTGGSAGSSTGGSGGASTGGVGGSGAVAGAGGTAGTGGDGACRDSDECAPSEYCSADSCGGTGECAARPTMCPRILAPVCGCDFETYDNDCEAAVAGQGVSSEGECPCFGNNDCAPDEYCGAMYACGGAGECIERPTMCSAIFAPVCGCDAETYDNDCLAAAAGVRVSAIGACDCDDNDDCDPDAYCNADTCDGPGVCEVKPLLEDCPTERDPASSCQSIGFDNACRAAAAGVRIQKP